MLSLAVLAHHEVGLFLQLIVLHDLQHVYVLEYALIRLYVLIIASHKAPIQVWMDLLLIHIVLFFAYDKAPITFWMDWLLISIAA